MRGALQGQNNRKDEVFYQSVFYFCGVKSKYITKEYLDQFIDQAFREDIGDGDHSTLSTIQEDQLGSARLIFKESGVAAGLFLAEEVMHRFDPDLKVEYMVNDGDWVEKGTTGLIVNGKIRAILSTERIVLNCLQRLSGIATKTHELVRMVEGTGVQLLDTRKTTPGWRALEKWAVEIGGGKNHRFGLFDMIMLKDNHIDYAGGITKAVGDVRNYLEKKGKKLRIEVETRNLEEVKEALKNDVDVIMLDNMTPKEIRSALKIIDKKAETEASGGITESSLREYAETGVDYISIGALTHSVKSLDISLKAVFL